VAFIRLPLGDITAGQLRIVAALGDAYGDGTVRLTPDQNVFIRWVEEKDLPHLFARLARAGLADPDASTVADVTSCPGAESCRLAVTQSRGLGRALTDALAARSDLVGDAATATVKISGCPNGCGQHHVATIGFQGSVRKLNGRAVPQYFVMIGGAVTTQGARFGRLTAKIPAARVGVALERLLEFYRQHHAAGETPSHFFARAEVSVVKTLLADLEVLTAAAAQPDDYIDLGDKEAFSPAILDGECAT
jgi:sulfite reductase beta subunit-like hemoprotein